MKKNKTDFANKPNESLPPHLREIVEQPVKILPVNWMDKITLPENPKNLRQLADEYPEKAGLQQLAQAWEDGELF